MSTGLGVRLEHCLVSTFLAWELDKVGSSSTWVMIMESPGPYGSAAAPWS